MSAKTVRADLDKSTAFMFEIVKRSTNLNADSEVLRTLIKDKYEDLVLSDKLTPDPLTENEKDMLVAWARDRVDLKRLNESDLGIILLEENQHCWDWLGEKLIEAVTYLFLKKESFRVVG